MGGTTAPCTTGTTHGRTFASLSANQIPSESTRWGVKSRGGETPGKNARDVPTPSATPEPDLGKFSDREAEVSDLRPIFESLFRTFWGNKPFRCGKIPIFL